MDCDLHRRETTKQASPGPDIALHFCWSSSDFSLKSSFVLSQELKPSRKRLTSILAGIGYRWKIYRSWKKVSIGCCFWFKILEVVRVLRTRIVLNFFFFFFLPWKHLKLIPLPIYYFIINQFRFTVAPLPNLVVEELASNKLPSRVIMCPRCPLCNIYPMITFNLTNWNHFAATNYNKPPNSIILGIWKTKL